VRLENSPKGESKLRTFSPTAKTSGQLVEIHGPVPSQRGSPSPAELAALLSLGAGRSSAFGDGERQEIRRRGGQLAQPWHPFLIEGTYVLDKKLENYGLQVLM
jgi:hypothetical protein